MALGFEGYSYTTALGRKRVVLLNNVEASSLNCNSVMPRLKRLCSDKIILNAEKSSLEALPLDILVRVLCGVDHEDLGRLIRVSKTIKEATDIARKMHFEYSTPKKNTFAIRGPFASDDVGEFEDIEAPKAPLRKPMSRFSGKRLAGISVALFASESPDEESQ